MRKIILIAVVLWGCRCGWCAEGAVFLPFRNVRGGQDFTSAGRTYAYYVYRNFSLLRPVDLARTGELEKIVSAHVREPRDRIEPGELRDVAKDLYVEELVWGTFAAYEGKTSFSLIYLNKLTNKSARVELARETGGEFETLDLLTVRLARELGWPLSDTPLETFLPRPTESVEALGEFLAGVRDYRSGSHSDAESHFRAAVEGDPGFEEARVMLGNAQYRQDRIAEARETFDSLPGSAEGLNNQGVCLAGEEQFPRAIQTLRKALRLKPEEPGIHYNLGSCYMKRQMDSETLTHLEKALELDPRFARAAFQYAVFLRARESFIRAEQLWNRAVGLDPGLSRKDYESKRMAPLVLMEFTSPIPAE